MPRHGKLWRARCRSSRLLPDFSRRLRSVHLIARIYELRHQPRWQEPILLAIGYVSDAYPDLPGELIRTAILAEGEAAREEGFTPSLYEDVLHRDLLFAAQCIGDCVTIESELRCRVVEQLVKLYLDSKGAGKYKTLREKIVGLLNYLKNSEAANEAAETALAALRDKNEDVRSSAAEALGEVKVGTAEVVNGLLAALRDENKDVHSSAAGALGELVKIRKPKLPKGLVIQVADSLLGMLDDLRNHEPRLVFVGSKMCLSRADVIWEALWLVCQRMDEQRC